MKKLLLFIVLVCGLPSLGWAGECSLFSSASCMVGNLEFSNIGWNSNVWAVGPNDMTAEASTGAGGLVSSTFSITQWWAFPVRGGPFPYSEWLNDWYADITFSVSCANGTNCISGVGLPTPEGAAVSEIVGSDAFPDVVQPSNLPEVTALPFPVMSVWVHEFVSVGFPFPVYIPNGGGAAFDQYASFGSAFVTSTTSTTPEPVSMVLMGTFLMMAGGLLSLKKRL